jgi:cysteine desulfurase
MIYLDHNATTPLDQRVLEAMMPYFTQQFANASSTHLFGVASSDAVKQARKQVAGLLGADTHEIVMTSGATEAINLALKGTVERYDGEKKHIITVATEHSAVLDTCAYLKSKGTAVTVLPVQENGLLDLSALHDAITPHTVLVSVMHANNETGVLQPIREIAQIAHEAGALMMTDATQSVGKIPVDVDAMGIDLLSLSAHKLYGPKGVGALYVRQRGKNKVKLPALLHGGGHERTFRSGTLNVPGIVGLGKACELAQQEMAQNHAYIQNLRDLLENGLLQIPHTHVNGHRESRLYNTTNIRFDQADSDAMIMALSEATEQHPMIAVSNGSACTSARIEPSHVLTAMGLDEGQAFSCLRFSLGKENTLKDVECVIAALGTLVRELRAMIA